jgi:hypothetical protein
MVLAESEIKRKCARKMIVLLLAIYRGTDHASRVANHITAFAIEY